MQYLMIFVIVLLGFWFFRAEDTEPNFEYDLMQACSERHVQESNMIISNRKVVPYPEDTFGDDVYLVVLNGKINGYSDNRNCVIRKDGVIIKHN